MVCEGCAALRGLGGGDCSGVVAGNVCVVVVDVGDECLGVVGWFAGWLVGWLVAGSGVDRNFSSRL